jgi:hypothetical protein
MGAVWSVPVILAATAAPAAAASNPPAVLAAGTLAHTTGKDYLLTMVYTLTAPKGSTATIGVTDIQAAPAGKQEDVVTFGPLPGAQSLSVGANPVPAVSVTRAEGSNSAQTVTVIYTCIVVVNGITTTTTQSVIVPISRP